MPITTPEPNDEGQASRTLAPPTSRDRAFKCHWFSSNASGARGDGAAFPLPNEPRTPGLSTQRAAVIVISTPSRRAKRVLRMIPCPAECRLNGPTETVGRRHSRAESVQDTSQPKNPDAGPSFSLFLAGNRGYGVPAIKPVFSDTVLDPRRKP